MPGSTTPMFLFSAAALACALAPARASAAPSPSHGARLAKERTCAKAAVEVVAGAESATFPLTQCDGTALASGVDELSVLGRPGTAPRPAESMATLAKIRGSEIAPGVRRLDSRLVQRLQLAVDHFAKDGRPTKIVVVSGYRPRNSGSYHSAGRALDFRIDGVKNDDLVAFCKTLPDTGCGFYPNNVFVHMDVREPGTGHVSWVDAKFSEAASRSVVVGPPKDSLKDSPQANREAPEDAKVDRHEGGQKEAEMTASTSPPGLLLARPLPPPGPDKATPAADKASRDEASPVAADKAPGVAKDGALPALATQGRHHGKHKHKSRKPKAQPTAQKPS